MNIAIVQHQSKFPLPLSMQAMLPALLHLLSIQHNKYSSNWESHYIASYLGTS